MGRGEGEKGWERENGKGCECETCPIYSIYLHILSYIFIYLYIHLYTFIYLHIPPNTFSLIYFKISNARKMRADIRHENCHNSSPRASPKARI